MHTCPHCHSRPVHIHTERRFRPFATLFKLILLYVILVAGAGTLINTGHPVAVELGRLIHVVSFIDPLIGWTDAQGLPALAEGVRVVANGVPL